MPARIKRFVSMVKVEMEDLADDLLAMQELSIRSLKDQKITEYVSRENMALLQTEFLGLRQLLEENILARTSAELSNGERVSLDDAERSIMAIIKDFIDSRGYPEGLWQLAKKRVHKIKGFLQEEPFC